MKRCRDCQEEKPIDQFYKAGAFYASYCKPCSQAQSKANRLANPEQYAATARRWRKANPDKLRSLELKRFYGITTADYEALLALQGGRCAGCGNGPTGKRKYLDTDHDHKTGEMRGLLCSPCNLILGKAQDNSTVLRNLADYLDMFRSV